MNKRSLKFSIFLLLVSAINGCASLPGVKSVQIGQRQIEFALERQQSSKPTVIFENGLGSSLQVWSDVFPVIAATHNVFTYNRPGYGNSEESPTPRDAQHIVAELRENLLNLSLPPPYILVGHSAGGLYMQYFARRYPHEVTALILVDSTHPQQLKGQGAFENWPSWYRLFFNLFASSTTQQELAMINLSGEQVLAEPVDLAKPVILLSALEPMQESSPLADDANQKRIDLLNLYPGARQIWVESGHMIPLEAPQTVIDAVNSICQTQC
jgi:pimeloyl-ACP methyl ester carboxylesterase